MRNHNSTTSVAICCKLRGHSNLRIDFGSDRPGEGRGMVRGKRTLVDGGACKSSAVKSKLKKIALVGKEDKQKDHIQGKEL